MTGFMKNITVEKMIEKKKRNLEFSDNNEKRRDEGIAQMQLLLIDETPGWSVPSVDVHTPPTKTYPSFTLVRLRVGAVASVSFIIGGAVSGAEHVPIVSDDTIGTVEYTNAVEYVADAID